MSAYQVPEPAPVSGDPDRPTFVDLSQQVARVAAPLRDQVLDLLRKEIVEMRLEPGQRLIERELVERIGVSRTTVREVLRQLAAEGLVTDIPQKGAVVATVSPHEAEEIYGVRELLEAAAARQCTVNATPPELQALREAADAVSESLRSNDEPRVMLQAKNRFYEALLNGAHNGTIRTVLDGLQARVAALRAISLTEPGRPLESVREIEAIVKGIEARDPDEAAERAAYHVRQAARAMFRQTNDSDARRIGGSTID